VSGASRQDCVTSISSHHDDHDDDDDDDDDECGSDYSVDAGS